MLKWARDVIAVEGTEGRNPFEVLVLIWAICVGIYFVLGGPTPGSIEELIPFWMVRLWYILLCTGGLVGLVGVWLRNLLISVLVERAAMMILSPSALLYAVAIYHFAGLKGASSAGAILVFAVAAAVRIVRIQAYLKGLAARYKLQVQLDKAAE